MASKAAKTAETAPEASAVPTYSFRESKLNELPKIVRMFEPRENPLTPVVKAALESGKVQEATGIADKEAAGKLTTALRNCARSFNKTVASRFVDGVLYWQVTDITPREKASEAK